MIIQLTKRLPFCFPASSVSSCPSVHLTASWSFTQDRQTNIFMEGWAPPPARRQEVTIYGLLSPHWKFHKLPFSSLWAISIATVFCFPLWQEEWDGGFSEERTGSGVRSGHSRGARSGESKEQNVDGCGDKTQEARRALSGFSCSGMSAQPNTALHKADVVWLTVTFS